MLFDDPRIELAERKRFLGIVVNETGRLTRLINQILDLAKLESGRAEWSNAEVDLAGVVRESVESMGQMYRDKGVALTLDLPAAGPLVRADRDRLTQVMINLLSNAQKFVATGQGRVSVSLAVVGGLARVAVGDNGPGVRTHRQAPRYRPGPAHQPPDHRVLRRQPVGGERIRPGCDLRLHAAAVRRSKPTDIE
jgi:signal transduction histidine kinase